MSNLTVSKETMEKLRMAHKLANFLNEEASLAMPALKRGHYNFSDVLGIALDDWIQQAKQCHVGISQRMERQVFGKITSGPNKHKKTTPKE